MYPVYLDFADCTRIMLVSLLTYFLSMDYDPPIIKLVFIYNDTQVLQRLGLVDMLEVSEMFGCPVLE